MKPQEAGVRSDCPVGFRGTYGEGLVWKEVGTAVVQVKSVFVFVHLACQTSAGLVYVTTDMTKQ